MPTFKQQIRFCTGHAGVRIAYATSGHGPPLIKAAIGLASTLFGLHLRFVGGRYRVDRLGDDSANGEGGLPARFATNVTSCGSVQALMIPPSHNAVVYSLAAGPGSRSLTYSSPALSRLLFGLCLTGLVLLTARSETIPRASRFR